MKVFCLALWLAAVAMTGLVFWAQWDTSLSWTWYSTTNQVIFFAAGVVLDLVFLALIFLAGLMVKDFWASS